MRLLPLVLTSLSLLLPAQAQRDDAFAQRYFGAYQNFLDAQEAENTGDFRHSLEEYEAALNQLEQLMREYPNHSSIDVVVARRQSVREAINRVRPQATSQSPRRHVAPEPDLPAPVRDRVGSSNQQIEQYQRQIEDLNRRMQENQQRYTAALQQARQERAEARAQLQQARDAIHEERDHSSNQVESLQAQIASLREELDAANERVAEAEARNTELLGELEQSRERIARLEEREQELVEERDRMIERARMVASEAGIADLVEENERLTGLYSQLQEDFEELQQQAEADNAEAVRLKMQVAELQQEVEELRIENDSYRRQLAEMEQHLEANREQLAASNADADLETAEAENAFLRAELIRQQHLQEHRERMRDILLDQLADIGQDSEEIRRTIDSMAEENRYANANRADKIQRLIERATSGGEEGAESGTIVADSEGETPQTDLSEADDQMRGIADLTRTASEDFAAGRYERALHSLDIILGTVPNDMPTLVSRGVVLLRLGRAAEAEETLKKALAQRAENSFARTMLALTFLEQENHERAIEELELAIDFNPADPRAHFYRGLVAQLDDDLMTAEAAYQEALTLAPGFADAHFNLASLLTHVEPVDGRRISDHYHEAVRLGAPRDLHIETVMEQNL